MRRIHQFKNPDWRLARCHPKDKDPNWSDTIPATVPGAVLIDVQRAGLAPDPFYGENFRACQWTGEWAFWYRLNFAASAVAGLTEERPERVRLLFEGIDTFAEVFFNGQSLGSVHNMFRRHKFDVTPLFRWPGDPAGENELLVRIDPPIETARRWIAENKLDDTEMLAIFGVKERIATRKAQMTYGWDNTPYLVAGGLFRPVRIETLTGPALEDVAWRVDAIDAGERTAKLVVSGAVEGRAPGAWVTVEGDCAGHRFEGEAQVGADRCWTVSIEVQDARLWWPNGAEPTGATAADLYRARIRLLDSEERRLDEIAMRIGLRTIEVPGVPAEKRLVRYRIGRAGKGKVEMDDGALGSWARVPLDEPEEVEVRPFVFHVNGRRLFIKGVDWQTPDSLAGRVTPRQTATLLDAARSANVNMIRIWGGSAIENDEFYQQCSERGLMVWQDFHFACGRYPKDQVFLDEVRGEAEDIVRRLRNHACLACWCGDNESDMMDYDAGRDPEKNPINKRILPDALRRLDPQRRHYHPSSPSGGPHPRSDWGGDKRNWGGWYPHRNYRHIRQEQARFISEAGTYALPCRETIERFMPPDLRWPLENRTWFLHMGDLDFAQKRFIERFVDCWKFFGAPKDLDEAIVTTQFIHAWGFKLLIERCRQRKYDCGGVMLWKLNDAWPSCDAGLLDYYLQPRMALDWVRRAYQPVAVSMSQDPDDPRADVEVWLVNDLTRPVRGHFEIAVLEVDETGAARIVSETPFSGVEAPADSSQPYTRIPVGHLDPAKTVLKAIFRESHGTIESESTFTLEPRVALVYHT